MRNKIVSAAEAVAIIRSGDTVASSGFVGVGTPDGVICALIGYLWMFAKRDSMLMLGDLDTGYIVTPASGEARVRLLTAAGSRSVRAA